MKYDKYSFNAKEWITILSSFLLIIATISYVFYDSYISILIMFLLFPLYVKFCRKKSLSKLRTQLDNEFLKSLGSISSSISAGLSAENAFIEAQLDMERLFGTKSLIVKELKSINRRIEAKDSLSDVLYDFAKRTKSSAIEDFALVFAVSRNCGVGFSKVIRNCVEVMESDRQIKEEARVLIRGKQMELRVMGVIPIGIVLYLRLSSGEFMNVLYHNPIGIFIMTICLAVYVLALFVSDRICSVVI